MDQIPKNIIENALLKYYNFNTSLTKKDLIKKINELIKNNILLSINAIQSLKIWNIYKEYLKDKYKDLPIIQFRISINNNLMLETDRVILEAFKERPSKVIIMKSAKNEHNKRFDFLRKKYTKYIETLLFPNIKDIDATGMRSAILEKDEKKFNKYLPKNMNDKIKNKIWRIVNK
jgi:hypothetical protein